MNKTAEVTRRRAVAVRGGWATTFVACTDHVYDLNVVTGKVYQRWEYHSLDVGRADFHDLSF